MIGHWIFVMIFGQANKQVQRTFTIMLYVHVVFAN